MMYSGTDYSGPGGLVDYVPKEFIPEFLGGPCEVVVNNVIDFYHVIATDFDLKPSCIYSVTCQKVVPYQSLCT